MYKNGSVLFLMGAALLAGCGAEEHVEVTQEGVLGEGLQVEAAAVTAAGDFTTLAYCDDVVTWSTAWRDFENQVLTLVNQRRAAGATCGGVYRAPVPALTLDTRLRCSARKHSRDMAVNNFFSHTGSNGWTPWQRITAAGYAYRAASENIAAGQTTPSGVVNSWMTSSGHCNNIMSSSVRHLGVGYYFRSGSPYGHYWTQNFGSL
jgi:uncharacterized protein YkwD